MLTQGKLITSDGDLNRISKRSYLSDINLAAFCDSHIHDTTLVSRVAGDLGNNNSRTYCCIT